MTFQNRSADTRLLWIEKALQGQGRRLNAIICRQDAGDVAADSMIVHQTVSRLMKEASRLQAKSSIGLAAKARMVATSQDDLSAAARALFRSLVDDLDGRDRYTRH